jgi:hypothetical protein
MENYQNTLKMAAGYSAGLMPVVRRKEFSSTDDDSLLLYGKDGLHGHGQLLDGPRLPVLIFLFSFCFFVLFLYFLVGHAGTM